MQSRLQLVVAVIACVLAWWSPREAEAQCTVFCQYVCCQSGYSCSADGYWCLPSGGGGGGGMCSSGWSKCPDGDCCPDDYSCCGDGCCPPGTRCGDIPGSCVEDDTAPLPECSGEFPVECGNGNCCSPSFPVCCPFTCCPLGTTCSANGFGCVGEPSISCPADKKLTMVSCEDEPSYCECANECTSDEDCATGCCRGGVCSHPCLCDDNPGKSTVTANVAPALCPVPNLSASQTGGLGRGGCAIGGAGATGPLALVGLAILLFRRRRAKPSR